MRLVWLVHSLILLPGIICLQALNEGDIGNCAKVPLNCTWFCDKDLPLVNRSTSGAFETDYLASIRYKPLDDKYTYRHTVFIIPGIQPHCLELSIRCGSYSYRRHNGNNTVPYKHQRMLQLSFRCEYTVVTYLVYYQRPQDCYVITLDHMNHKRKGNQPVACNVGQTRPCQLLGDGHRYILLLYCFKHVFGQELRKNAYWLFVNKRNTPEQNQQIMRQLSMPSAMLQVPSYDRIDATGKDVCRCDIFERYIREIKQCKRPFLPPRLEQAQAQKSKSNEPDFTVKVPTVSASGQMSNDQWNWFLVKCLLVVGTFATVSYALYMQLERHIEEQLADGNVAVKTDTVKIKFIKVQESVDSES